MKRRILSLCILALALALPASSSAQNRVEHLGAALRTDTTEGPTLTNQVAGATVFEVFVLSSGTSTLDLVIEVPTTMAGLTGWSEWAVFSVTVPSSAPKSNLYVLGGAAASTTANGDVLEVIDRPAPLGTYRVVGVKGDGSNWTWGIGEIRTLK